MPRPAVSSGYFQLLADDLAKAVGACRCLLSISGSVGQHPRQIVGYTDADQPELHDYITLLDQARHDRQPIYAAVHGQLACAVTLTRRLNGAVLLLFTQGVEIDQTKVLAAVNLLSSTVDALHVAAQSNDGVEDLAHLREIQVSRNLIRGVIDAIPMGLALIDTTGQFLAVNRPFAALFQLEPASLVGRKYGHVISQGAAAPAAQTLQTGLPSRSRRTIQKADGREALYEIASIPLRSNDGQIRQVVEVWEDITERVALQTQLVRAEKLAGIGQLAASIAHEVGNPLQAIQGFLSLFLEQCLPDTPNRRFLELAEEEIERIVNVLSRLRDLYRPKADVMAPVQMNELIDNVLLLTNKQLERSRVRVIRELATDLPTIYAVADQLKQVLLNLVLNATEAMRDGGVLHVQTVLVHLNSDTFGVQIAITDTGVGVSSDQLPRLFDGLHTTKERGMGLGLYTSKAIVDRHMGRIVVQSQLGEGTTFTITLPVRSEESGS
jgi:PAS domain S-box-containing protein